MKYLLDGELLYDKTCAACRVEFIGRAHDRCCGDRCRSRLSKRRRVARRRRDPAAAKNDRREYYRRYYAANREKLRARVFERTQRLRALDPRHFAEKNRAYRAANREVIKVAELWRVPMWQARAMIERGEFPA